MVSGMGEEDGEKSILEEIISWMMQIVSQNKSEPIYKNQKKQEQR